MRDIINDITLLAEPCEPVILNVDMDNGKVDSESKSVIDELKEVFDANSNVYALAAPQIGIKKRVFGIRFDDAVKFFINPIITKKQGLVIAPETLTGFNDIEILIGRPREVTAVYSNENLTYENNKFIDAGAKIFDQMTQLLDGIVPTELGLVSNINEDGPLSELTEEEAVEAQEMWKQFVKLKLSSLEKEIKADSDLGTLYKELKFTESVINGRTLVIANEEKKKVKQTKAEAQASLSAFLGKKH